MCAIYCGRHAFILYCYITNELHANFNHINLLTLVSTLSQTVVFIIAPLRIMLRSLSDSLAMSVVCGSVARHFVNGAGVGRVC